MWTELKDLYEDVDRRRNEGPREMDLTGGGKETDIVMVRKIPGCINEYEDPLEKDRTFPWREKNVLTGVIHTQER